MESQTNIKGSFGEFFNQVCCWCFYCWCRHLFFFVFRGPGMHSQRRKIMGIVNAMVGPHLHRVASTFIVIAVSQPHSRREIRSCLARLSSYSWSLDHKHETPVRLTFAFEIIESHSQRVISAWIEFNPQSRPKASFSIFKLLELGLSHFQRVFWEFFFMVKFLNP